MAKPKPKSKKYSKSKLSFLSNPRVRALLATVVFALVGTAVLVYTQAQQVSKAQCTIACVGIAAASSGSSQYWEVGADGGVFSFGGAKFHGSLPGKGVNVTNAIGIAANPAKTGYWIATKTGDVFNFGAAQAPVKHSLSNYGASVNNIVGIAAAPTGTGYYLVGSDGGVFAFDAPFHGSMAGKPMAAPVVGMTVRQQGGYWLVGADGGVFAFGGAPFHGGMAGKALNKPIVAMEAIPSGNGYWLVGADSGVFSFGDAKFHGSVSNTQLHAPVNAISKTASGNGYWLSASDGGVFAFGDAQFSGNALVPPPPPPPAKPAPTTSTPIKQQLTQTGTAPITCKPNELAMKDSTGKITRCINNGVTPNPAPAPVRPSPAPPAGAVSAPPRPNTCNGTPTLRQGSSGPCVVELQKLLNIAQDGKFGPGTKSSVINFQRSRGLAADGVVGPKTWAALKGNAPAVVVNLPPPANSIGSGLNPTPVRPPPPPAGDISSGLSPDRGASVKMTPANGNYKSSETSCTNIPNYSQWKGYNDKGAVDSAQGLKCRLVYEKYGTRFRDGHYEDCSIYMNLETKYAAQNWNWPGFRRRKNVGCTYQLNNNASYKSALFSGTACAPDADRSKCRQ